MPRCLLLVLCAALSLAGCSKKKPSATTSESPRHTEQPRPVEPPKSKEQQYDEALHAGKLALAEKRYEAAVRHFQLAAQLSPTDAARNGLQEAQRLHTEALRIAEEAAKKKRADDFQHAMTAGVKALEANDFTAALKSFDQALILIPADPKAAEHKRTAQRGEAVRLHRLGKAHYDRGNYSDALTALTEANKHDASNADVAALLKDTERQLGEKNKKDSFAKLLIAAQEAMTARKFTEAVKLYEDALKLFPRDTDVRRRLDLALKAETDEKEKHLRDYTLAMGRARNAVKSQDYQIAINAFNDALRAMPRDKTAEAELRDAEAKLKAATDAAKLKKLFDDHIKDAKSAMSAQKFTDAVKHFDAALKLFPTDADAKKGLEAAKKAVADAAVAEGMKQKQAFDTLVAQARAASAQKKHADAVKLYDAALKLIPNDAATKKAHADAVKADKQQHEDYQLALDAGRSAAKAYNYQGAINAFKQALVILPDGKTAQEGLQAAEARLKEFNGLMAQGKTAATAKKFADAIKHYEAALKVKPNDPDATAALKRAREGKP